MPASFDELEDDAPTDVSIPERAPIVPARLRLVVTSGTDLGLELALERGSYLVGKSSACALSLSDAAVSRQHLELQVTAEGVLVRDLGSTNGSYFEGARFTTLTLGAGAVVTIGSTALKLSALSHSAPIPPSAADRFGALLGRSLVMREVFTVLERVAASEVAVLIEGETGTGKELCAEALHATGARASGPFVVCDLAGSSRSLIESELFGHVRGAFTGAERDREGAFALAHGGTIFIDEIGELELSVQPRLLRALEQRKVKPVGASGYRDVDVRVIAATNRDLRQEIREGRFRADLFHRLAVVRVRLPALRERKEDLPVLIAQFLDQRGACVPPETLALLASYDWPGNVRELKNTLERGLSLLGSDRILSPALLGLELDPATALGEVEGGFRDAKERLISAWERQYVRQLLRRAGGNVSRAARLGGLDRVYLHRLIRKHRLAAVPEDQAGG